MYLPFAIADDNCSVNGGIGVSLKNPGCLGEAGRGSVYIPNTGLGSLDDNQFCLVITSNSGSCTCQNVGFDFKATGFCHQLNPSDQSYRFISVSPFQYSPEGMRS